MLPELIGKKLIEAMYSEVVKVAKAQKKSILISSSDVGNSINRHLQKINIWSGEISFKDNLKPKDILTTYIPLKYFLTPRRTAYNNELNKPIRKEISKIFETNHRHVIILGQPGAGKTTTMKYICHKLLTDESFMPEQSNFPMLIRLRDIELSSSQKDFSNILFNAIFSELGLVVSNSVKTDNERDDLNLFKRRAVITALDTLRPLLILDGFDELRDDHLKRIVLSEIKDLAIGLSFCKFILTCRSGDYDFFIENTQVYEISPLDDVQVMDFVSNWLNNKHDAEKFIHKLKTSPFNDTAIRPLTLAHLCAIYEREKDIPEKPKTVYRKVVNLLVEDWSIQNSVTRHSKFANFEPERKKEFLSDIAFLLTTEYHKTTFSTTDLNKCFEGIHNKYNLKFFEQDIVIRELETHNGLLLQSGADSFEFCHKSIQEFLTAEHIVKLPELPRSTYLLSFLPNELALATSLSSDPSSYLRSVIHDCILKFDHLTSGFVSKFFNRISLEKPDFQESKGLAIAIMSLYSRQKEELSKNYYDNTTILKAELLALNDTYKLLLNNECILKSFNELLRYLFVASDFEIEGIPIKFKRLESTERFTQSAGKKIFLIPESFFSN